MKKRRTNHTVVGGILMIIGMLLLLMCALKSLGSTWYIMSGCFCGLGIGNLISGLRRHEGKNSGDLRDGR